MQKLLTISIPTYNRYEYLKECLTILIPQVSAYSNEVEIFVTDNCSTDNTQKYLLELSLQISFLKYYRNKENLGYSGNQINCLQIPNSKYISILCDDDIYIDNALEKIVPLLKSSNYSFIALNYYSFKTDYKKIAHTNFAPINDVSFSRAYDVFNYPSVGHFSGFIFRTTLAKETLNQILIQHSNSFYELHRGVITDVANKLLSKTTLPSLFIGDRIVATRIPDRVDYNSFTHLCIDYYEYYLALFNEGYINAKDLQYRFNLVESWMPSMAIKSLYSKSKKEIKQLWKKIYELNLITTNNYFKMNLIFSFLSNNILRSILKMLISLYHSYNYKK